MSGSKREAVINLLLAETSHDKHSKLEPVVRERWGKVADRILAAVSPVVLSEDLCEVDRFGRAEVSFVNVTLDWPLPPNTRRRVALVDLGEVGT